MLNTHTRTSAQVEIGRRHPYAVTFGPVLFGVAATLALLGGAVFGVVFGVRWLAAHHPTAPNVTVSASNGTTAFGWIALALVATIAAVLLVRRIVRHIRYGV